MHSNEYQHAKYWFVNSYDRSRNLGKTFETLVFCMTKLMATCKALKPLSEIVQRHLFAHSFSSIEHHGATFAKHLNFDSVTHLLYLVLF